jgi:uncharacterized protein
MQISALESRQVDERAITVWRYRGLVWVLVSIAAFVTALMSTPVRTLLVAPAVWWVLGLAVAAVGLLLAWHWPRAMYRHLAYRVDDIGIAIDSGVLWRSQTALPRVRIQHTDVTQGPLQRRAGIATLKLYTAGSRFTEIQLPGLGHADALALRDRLVADIAGDER